jgi:geranylgeranyl reductase family protein
MKDGESVDVLIVGAGPAGSSAARSAAEAGTNVLVIEKRARIGEPIRCAEYIPRLLTQKVKVPREAIVQEIEGMVTFMPDGEVLRKSAPGFILDRAKFDQALAAQAERAGARFLTGNRAVCKADNEVTVVSLSGERGIRAKVVIGADGPGSTVGSWIGQRNRNVMWAVQQTVELKQSVHDTEVYFDREYPGGYAWLFPKGDVANVGVGVKRELGGLPKEAFRRFEERVKDRIGKLVSITAGRIPVGWWATPQDIPMPSREVEFPRPSYAAPWQARQRRTMLRVTKRRFRIMPTNGERPSEPRWIKQPKNDRRLRPDGTEKIWTIW